MIPHHSGAILMCEKASITDPEIVVAGLLPGEAHAAGKDVGIASYPLRANGRSLTLERSDGFVRIVFDKGSGQRIQN